MFIYQLREPLRASLRQGSRGGGGAGGTTVLGSQAAEQKYESAEQEWAEMGNYNDLRGRCHSDWIKMSC